mgnify:CR=1 FL=1
MIKDIAQYLRRKLSDNFVSWTDEALEDYVMFHVEREQLVAVQSDDQIQAVLAVIIGWPTEERQVEQFAWQEPTQHGRFWFWDQIASETPEACMICFSQFFLRRPESVQLPSFGIRHGKIRDFKPALLIYKKGNEIYGH